MWTSITGDIEVALAYESKGRKDPGCKEASIYPTEILTLVMKYLMHFYLKKHLYEMKTINICCWLNSLSIARAFNQSEKIVSIFQNSGGYCYDTSNLNGNGKNTSSLESS